MVLLLSLGAVACGPEVVPTPAAPATTAILPTETSMPISPSHTPGLPTLTATPKATSTPPPTPTALPSTETAMPTATPVPATATEPPTDVPTTEPLPPTATSAPASPTPQPTIAPTQPPPPAENQGCYLFQNFLGADVTVTLTAQDWQWSDSFTLAPNGEQHYCLDPGRYTFTLDAPPPWGSTNGELDVQAGDRYLFPIRGRE
jgi:hypothetical protein